ncbi:poly A polymerase C-terminal region-like protein [Xylona heveae TC161]|uniref:Poly A polymerase C-terminal region-like protein n=1 Tax=Xylona heveae (strain CBS 132557 / TC161) TaxID=1328760 RepID=A0A165HAV1_XYLHT|nr:poly A polymerase C-terminal region-like protein [Xylona heveae TC161]KZF23230.1 poly A polymerase C-terminal region-like protein [Xylona heveae TC161]
MDSKRNLMLTPVEGTLRKLLLDVADYIDGSTSPGNAVSGVPVPPKLAHSKLELRFTGGWVRDKLLGIGSHDIDVAINNMTGYQFGLKMKEYLEVPGNLEKYGLGESNDKDEKSKTKVVGGLHKIEANPEKSKHLETVTTKILGLDIDLVNLRKETYSEDSRNPQMEFGTAEEDALRRDATVNALFYNLQTCSIEDLTQRGLNDMAIRLVRTPLQPLQTFKDDPLRVLRLIRFASRLSYEIDPEAEEAMSEQSIRDALKLKISRERVGTEIEKMLKGPDPRRSLQLIDRLRLYTTIFTDPTQNDAFTPETSSWHYSYECVHDILSAANNDSKTAPLYNKVLQILIRSSEEAHLAWILASLTPYSDAPNPAPAQPGGKALPPVAATVAREGIKATNKVFDVIWGAFKNLDEINKFKAAVVSDKRGASRKSSEPELAARDHLGMAIRRWGANWRSHVLLALLLEVVEARGVRRDAIIRDYSTFLSHIEDLDLFDVYALKPILDGKQLAKALDTKPGPWMKDALEVVMAWQLRHPKETGSDGAIEEVKNGRGELNHELMEFFLRHTVRPLFSKSQNPEITPQGRKAMQPQRTKGDFMNSEATIKPWKFKEAYAMSILEWILKHLNEYLTEEFWPLLVPPLMTIVDDDAPEIKAKGCFFLNLLLQATSPSLLDRTGLGEVMAGALLPCFTYLPTLTPEDQSLEILNAAFPALITLSRVRYPEEANKAERLKFLDLIMRQGVFHAYEHAGEHVKIAETLIQHVSILVDEMGIYSAKHLKFVIPILSDILDAPFATAYPPLLATTLSALENVITIDWPRMALHRGEILRGLTSCWCKLKEDEASDHTTLKQSTKNAVKLLTAAVKSDAQVELASEFKLLVESDERLSDLLEDP